MLADGARLGPDNKLYIFGGQWDQVLAPIVPTTQKVAFALVVEVDYLEALNNHQIDLILEDGDSHDAGARVTGHFMPGHPPGTAEGSPVIVPLAIEPPPILIQGYGRFIWKVLLDGEDAGEMPMTVRPATNPGLPLIPPDQPHESP